MRTECKQVRFEFHQLSQRKVKARFDGGKITSDAGVLLLREVERGTGLIAGLAECFRDHRDPRLIEHTVEELLGQRIYGLCLGYEDLNDHDQLRTDPMLAVAVDKADPLGERRRQASDRGKALAGKCTLNRLELTGAEVDEQEHKRTAVGSVRRPDQRGNDARQSTPAVSVLRRLHAHARLASSRTEADPPGSRSVSDDSLEAPEDRRPGPPHGPPRLDLHVGSLSLQRGLRCRRSKPPGHSSALLRSVPIKRPQKRNRSIAQAELCLNAFRHALPNPKNAPFTTLHTTASLDLDRIDSETLRKPFRPAKITFISKSVIYAG